MKRMMMATVLLVLASVGTGFDSEPEGSCTTTEYGNGERGDESHQVCRRNYTASACAAADGKFTEGDDCFLFDLFRIPAAGA